MTPQIKGPAIFLAQFAGDAAPFNSLEAINGRPPWAIRAFKSPHLMDVFLTLIWPLKVKPIAMKSRVSAQMLVLKSPIFQHTCKDSWLR